MHTVYAALYMPPDTTSYVSCIGDIRIFNLEKVDFTVVGEWYTDKHDERFLRMKGNTQ